MNFLALCQRAQRECAIPGLLTTTVGQSGELQRLVDWVATAYRDICSSRDDWKFLKSNFQITTVADQQAYEITDARDTFTVAPLIGFGSWLYDTFRIYRESSGVGGEMFLPYQMWGNFRNQWMIGNIGVNPSTPIVFSIRPHDDAIFVGPRPNDVYIITGEYQIEAGELTQDDEAPLFPQRYHMAIVWQAAQYYAAYEEDAGLWQDAGQKYKKLVRALERYQLTEPTFAGPLA